MKVKVIKDLLGYVESLVQTGTEQDTVEVDLGSIDFDWLNCYKVVYSEELQCDTLELDEDKKAQIIADREAQKEAEKEANRLEAQVYYTALMTDTLLED